MAIDFLTLLERLAETGLEFVIVGDVETLERIGSRTTTS
jgi:hypothetical protein